jgi:hypothetical protein
VVLKIAADLRRIDHNWNLEVREVIGWPDTRQHQQLRRVDGGPAQDDLALRPDRLAYPISNDLDAARSSAFNYDARGDRLRQQFQISASPGRLHISNRGAGSAAVLNVGVDPAKTLGDIGIEVVDHGNPASPAAARNASQIGRSSCEGFTTIGPLPPCHSLAPRALVSALLK